MEAVRRARAFAALAVYAGLFLLIAAPQLYMTLAVLRLTRASPQARRKRIDRWQMAWMSVAFTVVLRVAGIKVDFRIPDDPYIREGGSFIIIANHLGGFDGILLVRLLKLCGRKGFRSIMKREVASWPIIGTACRANGSAFVARSGETRDILRVEWCGKTARTDGASPFIFPEGTVFHSSKAKDGFTRVLPPRSGGLRALLRAMPDCPILSATIHWHDLRREDDVLEGVLPPGSRVTVDVSIFRDVTEADAEHWLQEEWRRKDALLTDQTKNRS